MILILVFFDRSNQSICPILHYSILYIINIILLVTILTQVEVIVGIMLVIYICVFFNVTVVVSVELCIGIVLLVISVNIPGSRLCYLYPIDLKLILLTCILVGM